MESRVRISPQHIFFANSSHILAISNIMCFQITFFLVTKSSWNNNVQMLWHSCTYTTKTRNKQIEIQRESNLRLSITGHFFLPNYAVTWPPLSPESVELKSTFPSFSKDPSINSRCVLYLLGLLWECLTIDPEVLHPVIPLGIPLERTRDSARRSWLSSSWNASCDLCWNSLRS